MRQFMARLTGITFVLLAWLPLSAPAAFLDLADGSYNVTLNCIGSTVIACPSQTPLLLTISGGEASFMQATINGELFSGNPAEFVITNATADFEGTVLTNTPFSFLSLRNDLSIPSAQGLGDHWWNYCNNNSPSTCTPNTAGNWTATPIANVPLPSTAVLLAGGLLGLGALRRRTRG